jgi:16S rRNA (cytosine967-C5)-methyltransferase
VTVTPARTAALEILQAVGRGRRLDLAFGAATRRLPERERHWVHELTYGTVRLRGRIDHLLDHHVHRGVETVEGPVLDALRLGAYQVLRMGSVPAYAAVSQTVTQARSVGGKGAGALANAVLRAVTDRGEDPELFPRLEEQPARHLASWGSHPLWLVERWLARWPTLDVLELVERNNRVPALTVVPLGRTAEQALAALREAGVEAAPVGRGTECLEVAGGDPARVLQAVACVVQDPGASLVVPYAGPGDGARAASRGADRKAPWVADLCAAPGGKALSLAGRGFYVLAADRSVPRLRLLQDNVARTGLRVGLAVAVAERPPVRGAPMVLLDAPCTGTGTLGRHPDARWRLRPSDVKGLARVQARMLDGAAEAVAVGGLLVYSTCTLEPEENRQQVDAFLERHAGFSLEPPEAPDPRYVDPRGLLEVLPQRTGFDGAFAARLRRVE